MSKKLPQQVYQSAHAYQFEKLAELLEKSTDAKVGFTHLPAKEAVLFRANPSLGFAKADIESLSLNNKQHQLDVNFLGLYGPTSPLPTYMTEAIIAEQIRVSHEDLKVYYLTNQADIRSFQSQRIDVSAYLIAANAIRQRIRNEQLQTHRLDEQQMKALREGVRLSQVVDSKIVEQFNGQQLVFEVAEKAASRLRDFFDIFNHRLISLYYRATKKYQPYRDYQVGGVDLFSEQIYALMGAPRAEQRARSAIHWPRLLRFVGLLSMQSAVKERLIKVLSGYFGLSCVDVKEGVLRYAQIPEQQQCRLGQKNVELGESFMLGEQVPDRSGKFTVFLGRLDFKTFNQFLPPSKNKQDDLTGKHYQALHELIKFIAPPHLLYNVELEILDPPEFTLGGDSQNRLGWSVWLGNSRELDKSLEPSRTVVIE